MQDSRGTWQYGQLLRPPTGISSEPLIKTFHVTLKAQHPAAAHLMKVVFPVEYWPTNRTMGLLSKSASSRAGEWNSWKR